MKYGFKYRVPKLDFKVNVSTDIIKKRRLFLTIVKTGQY